MSLLRILFLILCSVVLANAQKTVLTGTVYDANGAVIPKIKVVAINEKGEKFEDETNEEGIYALNLSVNLYDAKTAPNFRIAKYEINVGAVGGFGKFVVKDFKLVPAYQGKMVFDIALDTDNSNCGAGGCIEFNRIEIESEKSVVSNKIFPRPLENLPGEENKTKRKNKNNKQ